MRRVTTKDYSLPIKGVLVRRDGLEYDVVIINAGSADLSISPCLAELVADEVSRAEGTVTGGHSA